VTSPQALAQIEAVRAAIDAVDPAGLPGVIGQLEALRAHAWARMTAIAATPTFKLITIEEAVEIARVPKRRIRSWARSAPWAVRLGRRVRVEETVFRRWLLSSVPGERERTRTRKKARAAHPVGLVSCSPDTSAALGAVDTVAP